MCGSPAAAPAGGGRRLSRTQNGDEERKGIDCGWHPDQSRLVRVPLRALSFPPKNFEFAEDTYIQETMSSYAHLVLKKKKKGKKEKQLFHPLHVPCFHQINKASRREWTGAGGRPRCARRGFLRASRSSPASCTSTCPRVCGAWAPNAIPGPASLVLNTCTRNTHG